EIPAQVEKHLRNPRSETPKPGNSCFRNTEVRMAARPADMVAAVEKEARRRGFEVVCLGAGIEGEARRVGEDHARLAARIAADKTAGSPPVLILSGGETTVTLNASGGRGGR